MVDSANSAACDVEASLVIEGFDEGEAISQVSVSTEGDGNLRISTAGKLPKTSLRELRQIKKGLQHFVRVTGQDVTIEHEGQQLLDVTHQSPAAPKLAIRWWPVLRLWLRNVTG